MFSWLPTRLKREANSRWKGLRIALLRKSRPFSKQDLLGMLRRLGVRRGDALLVHSSFDQFGAFLAKPSDVILVLQEAVGPEGLLLMPTMPFSGSAVDYAKDFRVFDVRRTPSKMGLLTELFRRAHGVLRSVHPTHSVAVWGSGADAMIEEHYKAATPCGKGTPYARLLERGGKTLLLGTGIAAMTLFHTVEEFLEPEMPFSPFTKEVFTLQSRDTQDAIWVSHTRLFDPYYSRRRNLDKLVPMLKVRGWWREERMSGLNVILLDANQVLEASRLLARQEIYCYDE